SGQFYKQFALTIAAATAISALNALTLSPALAALILKPHAPTEASGHHEGHGETREALPRPAIVLLLALLAYWQLGSFFGGGGHGAEAAHDAGALATWGPRAMLVLGGVAGWLLAGSINAALNRFFAAFNGVFDRATAAYGRGVQLLLRASTIALVVYVGLLVLTGFGFSAVPAGFIPEQDKGYLVVNAQLPDGASLERSEEVMRRVTELARSTPGVQHVIGLPGYSVLTSNNISNVAGGFIILAPFEERLAHGQTGPAVLAELRRRFATILDAQVVAFGAPPVEGLGTTGGFKVQIQDRADAGFSALEDAVANVAEKGNAQPGLVGLFSSFRAKQPQLYLEVDRTKAKALGVALSDVFETLQIYLGSAYANDFTRFGRNWQVNLQADSSFRIRPEDVGKLKVRSVGGDMIPLATLLTVEDSVGPAIVNRYNMFTAAEINGNPAPGTSSGQATALMEAIANQELPRGMGYQWTELTLQQILAGNTAPFVFALGSLFVFLVLAAQYESWSLPLAIILIVPMCLLSAIGGIWLAGMDNNIFTQIGFVVLIGLAAKNAILIVEFAKAREDEGADRSTAAIDACRLRLRPILMTSFAFGLGVLPLVTGSGAGAEMRNPLGVAVFSGMMGVTGFGLLLTPVFYVVIRGLSARGTVVRTATPGAPEQSQHTT
ncbi:MAG: efflux RND transporter permease subunit, partial [Deltaproteobacteria bacterium]|nr:efflux RND transporter permease subunit [Deltaproteobacteria bacterium]